MDQPNTVSNSLESVVSTISDTVTREFNEHDENNFIIDNKNSNSVLKMVQFNYLPVENRLDDLFILAEEDTTNADDDDFVSTLDGILVETASHIDNIKRMADGWKLIHVAASYGNDAVVSCLVEKYGANVNVYDNDKQSPLFLAAE